MGLVRPDATKSPAEAGDEREDGAMNDDGIQVETGLTPEELQDARLDAVEVVVAVAAANGAKPWRLKRMREELTERALAD